MANAGSGMGLSSNVSTMPAHTTFMAASPSL